MAAPGLEVLPEPLVQLVQRGHRELVERSERLVPEVLLGK